MSMTTIALGAEAASHPSFAAIDDPEPGIRPESGANPSAQVGSEAFS
jgi:hypothetical protein